MRPAARAKPAPGAPRSAGVERIGVLGGTFDPIHYGHLAVAEEVREALALRMVLFVPARLPPHKPDQVISPGPDRAAMVELAIAGNPGFALSRIELDRDGPSYTVDTITEIKAAAARQEIERDIVFILSTEALAGLPTWRDPWRLLGLCRLAVVPRHGFPFPERSWLESRFPGLSDRVQCVETVPLAHSASDVRRRAEAGRSIAYLVPPAVEAYIRQHRLYRSDMPRRTD